MHEQQDTGANASLISALLVDGAVVLGGFSARLDCEVLLAHVLGKPRGFLYAHRDAMVDADTGGRYFRLLERRKAGEPVAYLTGRREFWSLDLEVDCHTLVPRPETELLVELALQHAPETELRVLDLGTGCGALALALAHERPRWQVTGVDIDGDALRVARRNAERLALTNLELQTGDWFETLAAQQFGLIVANPPYVCVGDPCLEAPGLCFEPRHALASGSDGLDALRRIITAAPRHLQPPGCLLCEHGAEQGETVRSLFRTAGFEAVETHCDLSGRERVTLGTLKSPAGGGA